MKNEVSDEATSRNSFDHNNQVKAKRKHFLNRPKRYKDVARYYCDLCHYSTKGEENLKTHIQQVHELGLIALVKCDKCEFVTSSMRFLKVHMSNAHLGRADGTLICQYCGFRCLHEKRLTRHVAMWHKDPSRGKQSARNLSTQQKKGAETSTNKNT